jgi:predicted RNA-binding Zn-ribbon protein involved in translation (DUF1610 family)
MKKSHKCPKCNSESILRIPGTVGSYGVGNNIRASFFSHVRVTRYLCSDCGYSEEWVDSPTDRMVLKHKFRRAPRPGRWRRRR